MFCDNEISTNIVEEYLTFISPKLSWRNILPDYFIHNIIVMSAKFSDIL